MSCILRAPFCFVWTNRILIGFLPAGDAHLNLSATPDPRILAFTLGISVITGILFGLFPAVQSARVDLNTSLKE